MGSASSWLGSYSTGRDRRRAIMDVSSNEGGVVYIYALGWLRSQRLPQAPAVVDGIFDRPSLNRPYLPAHNFRFGSSAKAKIIKGRYTTQGP